MRVVEGKGWVMIAGDCADVLPKLDPVDHVITDPPYGFGAYATDKDRGAVPLALARMLRGALSMSVFGYPEVLVGWCMAIDRVPDEWIVWWPTNAETKAGGRALGLPRQTEHIAVWGPTPGAASITRPRSEASIRKPQNARLPPEARVGDVWREASPGIGFNAAARLHPNEKPVELLMKLVRLVSSRGEIILDAYAGSGTTGVAALRLGRRFVGIELDPKFFALACERLAAEERGTTLTAARAGQGALFGGSR